MSSRHDRVKSGSFLDTLFGGRPKKGSSVSPRPSSDYDLSGSGGSSGDLQSTATMEAIQGLASMGEHKTNEKFEEMLDLMNLSEEKKKPLRMMTLENKKKMLTMHYKGSSQENRPHSKFDKPADYINYLSQPDLSASKTYSCVESLRIALTNNTLSWVQEFGQKGLKQLLSTLNECYRNENYERVQYECIRCLSAIMNNTVGIKEVFEQSEALTILARSLEPNKPQVMCEAVKVLAAVCLIPPEGHEKVLEAITMSGEFRGRERFLPVVQGLMVKHSEPLRVGCLQLINAIVTSPDDLDFRLHLRNEIMRTGLYDVIDTLKTEASDLLKVQVTVFDQHREEDYDEFLTRFDNVKLEMDDVNDCFEVIKNLTMDSTAEPYLLSIFQHLLYIRDDYLIRPAYYKLIEECVAQIVLHRPGYDPDFRATKRFNIDVTPLIDGLVEKSQAEEIRIAEELNQKMEQLLQAKQEAEAKVLYLEGKLRDLGQGQISPMKPVGGGPPPPPMPGAPPPPPMPGMVGPPGMPPPPPMPGMVGPPPPPMPGMGPPPPPMPGMGGAPPPPPPPGPGGPPPPPMMGMGPPPPPGMPFLPMMPRPDVLPHGLQPKKKYEVQGPLKRANWKAIVPQKMSSKSFWVRCKEDQLAHPDILTGLANKFSSKPMKRSDDVIDKPLTLKKTVELKILDGKSAQNISIMLGGSLKHLTHEQVKTCLLQCDTNVLNPNVLQQLIQYIPPADQLKKLQELQSQGEPLSSAEMFCATIAGVKRLHPRLNSLNFKNNLAEMVQDVKPDIVAGTAACEEIRSSGKFAKILELVLLLGNYMNSGSKNGQAFGFEISFLTKLNGTKDLDNKQTLLHYLVETIEHKFPEVLVFHEELPHVDRASRVSLETIQKSLRQMDSSVKNLQKDLSNNKVPQGDDDKFLEIMGSFSVESRQIVDLLNSMLLKMEALYKDVAEFFAFDHKKCPLDEFFLDIKTFKDNFAQAYKDNIKIRETEEKARRAKEARDKAEIERQERASRKVKLVDMNAAHTQEGVMDSLLEAINSGSAFTREQRRKRTNPRVAGAERRAQLNRSRSRTGLTGQLTGRELSSELLAS